MTILSKNYWSIVIIVIIIIIIGIVIVTYMSKRQSLEFEREEIMAYEEYLLALTPEEVILEHFKNKMEHDIPKIKATVVDKWKGVAWEQDVVRHLEVLYIAFNEDKTEEFIKYVNNSESEWFYKKESGDDNDFPKRKVFDVTYYVEYESSLSQSSGEWDWRYYMIKISDEEPWLVEEFGSVAG